MEYLSIGAVFRMENSWLGEWIAYHRHVGVERFYLYSDDADTRVPDRILKPYIEKGIVKLRYVKHLPGVDHSPKAWRQKDVYRIILQEVAAKTEWVAMIDLDEFLLPRTCDDMRELLEAYEPYSALAVHWCNFGTSGFVRRPPTQINHLLRRGDLLWDRNRYVKSIVRPRRVEIGKADGVHWFPTTGGGTVNENQEPVVNMESRPIVSETVRLNHYILRSWQDYWEVKAVRNRSREAGACDDVYFRRNDRNEIFDDEISTRFGKVIAGE
ncbi:MAG TPA: hypothetical protein DEB39_12315 [Planctomycetaceae bacterium]|nr:hypothetical protein [Planctomycetaceae bacterium]